ncbi:hypothetical protein IE53DRAFT_369461 [Violaceomyces palustris]|uniref:Uncharacterized protein n=1 Tax=Violaceomyces palustris TaxID=1673888 RepID=A0ACD0NVE4_9BASI|nr:hypothetical protein IE53DRAFT_369461 [Violaceomyces palustris]
MSTASIMKMWISSKPKSQRSHLLFAFFVVNVISSVAAATGAHVALMVDAVPDTPLSGFACIKADYNVYAVDKKLVKYLYCVMDTYRTRSDQLVLDCYVLRQEGQDNLKSRSTAQQVLSKYCLAAGGMMVALS